MPSELGSLRAILMSILGINFGALFCWLLLTSAINSRARMEIIQQQNDNNNDDSYIESDNSNNEFQSISLPISLFPRGIRDYGDFLRGLLRKWYSENDSHRNILANLVWIYAITPTYAKVEQSADLTRLGQTLAHVDNLHWIVVEDSKTKSEKVERILKRAGVSGKQLNELKFYAILFS